MVKISTTEHLNLKLTSDTDDQMTFAEWRKLMNGEDADSNMEIIDRAFSEQAMKPGGMAGQVLSKRSNNDFDVEWANAQSGGGVGTVTTVDDVEPDENGDISLFRMITGTQLEELIENPELVEAGVKYYTEDPTDAASLPITASDIPTDTDDVSVQDAIDGLTMAIENINTDGVKGDKGDKGDPFTYEDFTVDQLESLRGPQGEQGERGAAFVYDDFTSEQLEALQGPQGEQGQQGERGSQGERGEKGEPGEQGLQGIQGQQGEKGESGVIGHYGVYLTDTQNFSGTQVLVPFGAESMPNQNFSLSNGVVTIIGDVKCVQVVVQGYFYNADSNLASGIMYLQKNGSNMSESRVLLRGSAETSGYVIAVVPCSQGDIIRLTASGGSASNVSMSSGSRYTYMHIICLA